ncbi:type I-E CRISPR-associated protein Cse1/CasA, partial [Ruminococcus sp.]
IKFEISRCEELAKKIGNLAWNIYLASGGNKNSKPKDIGSILDAKSQLYYRLDIPFRSWLSSLDPENDDKLEKFEQWQNTAKRITLDLGRELVAAVDDTAMVGHMIDETIYSAPKAYNIFLRDVSKIYQKI